MASRRRGALRAFRIADSRHPIFDSAGAALWGARWSSPGRRIIYAAETFAGAMLENRVHLRRVPRSHAYVVIAIPPSVGVEHLRPEDLAGWDAPDERVSRAFGDQWYDEGIVGRRAAVLVVPSIVTRYECNLLIHQEHRDFRRIRAGRPQPVIWDERLFDR